MYAHIFWIKFPHKTNTEYWMVTDYQHPFLPYKTVKIKKSLNVQGNCTKFIIMKFKSILITGVDRGIGLELVRQLSESDTTVKIIAGCFDPDSAKVGILYYFKRLLIILSPCFWKCLCACACVRTFIRVCLCVSFWVCLQYFYITDLDNYNNNDSNLWWQVLIPTSFCILGDTRNSSEKQKRLCSKIW